MFAVIKKPLTPNTIWDAENRCLLCKFENGKLETNDTVLVEKLKSMGHEITGEADILNQNKPEKMKRKQQSEAIASKAVK